MLRPLFLVLPDKNKTSSEHMENISALQFPAKTTQRCFSFAYVASKFLRSEPIVRSPRINIRTALWEYVYPWSSMCSITRNVQWGIVHELRRGVVADSRNVIFMRMRFLEKKVCISYPLNYPWRLWLLPKRSSVGPGCSQNQCKYHDKERSTI